MPEGDPPQPPSPEMATTATVQSNFVFVHSDVNGSNRSKLSRAIVRSQAARSARFNAGRVRGSESGSKAPTLPRNGKRKPLPWYHQHENAASETSGAVVNQQDFVGDFQHLTLLTDPVDPLLMSQPLLAREYSPLLISHYLSQMAIDIPELDLDTPGLLRSLWFPFVLSSDALLHVILLTAGANYTNYIHMSTEQIKSVRQCLVHLKQGALQEMRQLAFSTTETHSDVMIAAALKMASYEAIFGSQSAFQTHMNGVSNLLHLKGGLDTLGLDGLLARMVCWVDCNSSFLHNTRLHFADQGSMLPKPMPNDPQSFVGDS